MSFKSRSKSESPPKKKQKKETMLSFSPMKRQLESIKPVASSYRPLGSLGTLPPELIKDIMEKYLRATDIDKLNNALGKTRKNKTSITSAKIERKRLYRLKLIENKDAHDYFDIIVVCGDIPIAEIFFGSIWRYDPGPGFALCGDFSCEEDCNYNPIAFENFIKSLKREKGFRKHRFCNTDKLAVFQKNQNMFTIYNQKSSIVKIKIPLNDPLQRQTIIDDLYLIKERLDSYL